MILIHARCQSIAPMIMNQADDARLRQWVDSPGGQEPLPDPVRDFQSRIYRDPKGRVAIYRNMLMTALKFAGREVKLGRNRVTTREGTLLPSILRIHDEWIPLDGGEVGSDVVFVRDVRWSSARRTPKEPQPRIAGDGHRIAEIIGPKQKPVRIVRPKVMKWGFNVSLEVETPGHAQIARQLFERAGTEAGLGDFRPSLPNRSEWKSPFGRFRVEAWEMNEPTNAAPRPTLVFETV